MTRLARTTLAAACLFLFTAPAAATIPACVAEPIESPGVAGVDVRDLAEREGDYRILRVEASRGAYLLVYYDAGSEAMARGRAACLGAQLNLLQSELGDTREGAEWASVVFTTDQDYVQPGGPGAKIRWVVYTTPSDTWGMDPQNTILMVIPHEQVHDFQSRSDARVPRWFAEGHATWVGTRISSLLQTGLGEAKRATTKQELENATGPLNLAAWGGTRPKREAVMRQVSDEERARMEADPDYWPSVTLRLTVDDLEGDESNLVARYAGALMVFEALEERHGAAKVRAWAHEVTSTPSITPAALAESVRRHFAEDLDALLAEPATAAGAG